MTSLRPELDGRRLVDSDRTHAWLVFHGLRHYIVNATVYDSLLRPDLSFENLPGYEEIAEGPDLAPGSCLVSNAESGEIYLVFGSPAINIRKHLIETYETFTALGFADALVRAVPPIVLAAIPSGRPIRFEAGM